MEFNSNGNFNCSKFSVAVNNGVKDPRLERSYVNFQNPPSYQRRDSNRSEEYLAQMNQGRSMEVEALFPPPKTHLEKLFNHATEVKGDLESVINALAGIISTGNTDTHYQDIFPKNRITPNMYEAVPTVNVENVLKIVRANKVNYEKSQLRCDSSQSSESSKEKIVTKLGQDKIRSLLSDPGHIERRSEGVDIMPNRRKHKSRFCSNINLNAIAGQSEVFIKRSKSIKSESHILNNSVSKLSSNTMAENSRQSSENGHLWVDPLKTGSDFGTSNTLELFNLRNPEIMAPDVGKRDPHYEHPRNRYWSPNKEIPNVHDESSCSSWSVMSHEPSQLSNNKCTKKNRYERNIGKQTSSVSVSDSEESTEAPRVTPVKKIPRLPSLCTQLRFKEGQYELILINQPEQHHRARYLTEGSRGAVKDRSGNGFPTIKLMGWKRPATLQIFVGTEDGRVKPHNFYQACKVSGKQIISCKERIFDGTGLIEIQIDCEESQMIVLDCIGILKLRNVDVERRAGIQRLKLKSAMARLVFRVTLPHGDGFSTCLQVMSDSILCTQPIGSPEISKMSLSEGSCKGNMEMFIIGKNIVKCCQVLFQDYSEHNGVLWQADAKIDVEYLQQSHVVCTVPPYCNQSLRTPLTVQVLINCSGRLSAPHCFTYLPDGGPREYDFSSPYQSEEWKVLKTDYVDLPPFPMDNDQLNSELSTSSEGAPLMKSTDDQVYGMEYDKPNIQSFSNQRFPSSSSTINYNKIRSFEKSSQYLPVCPSIEWIPRTAVNDISIPSIDASSSNETMSNSLDSNIQNDFMLHFPSSENPNMTILLSESRKTLTESDEMLTIL